MRCWQVGPGCFLWCAFDLRLLPSYDLGCRVFVCEYVCGVCCVGVLFTVFLAFGFIVLIRFECSYLVG